MTKIRPALSVYSALTRALGILLPENAAVIVDKSEAYLRACSDPDKSKNLSFADELALDMACKAEGEAAPFYDLMGLTLARQGSEEVTDFPSALLELHMQSSELSAVIVRAREMASPGGAAFTASEKAKIEQVGLEIIADVQRMLQAVKGRDAEDDASASTGSSTLFERFQRQKKADDEAAN